MFLGKALRVFAATLVFSSSISFATGEGTGPNIASSAPGGAQEVNPLVFPTIDVTNPLSDGTTEVLSFGTAEALSEGETDQIQELVKLEIQENNQAGGHSSILVLNPDQDSREFAAKTAAALPANSVVVNEQVLPKAFSDQANGIFAKIKNQVRVDPGYKERIKEFGKDYWSDMTGFFAKDGKAYNKFNIQVSLVRVAGNSVAPSLAFIISHGLNNFASHLAFLPHLELGLMSGVVFTYLSPFIPWNRELPKPANTTFWKGVDLLLQAAFYETSEGVFIDGFRHAEMFSNNYALNHGGTPQYKVMTEAENWGLPHGLAGKSSLAQAPYDLSFAHRYKTGLKEQNDLLKANPQLAEQVKTTKLKLLNNLALRGTILSVLTTLIGLSGAPHSFISNIGFYTLYLGAVVVVGWVFQSPGKFQGFVKSIREYYAPKAALTNEEKLVQCSGALDSIAPPKNDL